MQNAPVLWCAQVGMIEQAQGKDNEKVTQLRSDVARLRTENDQLKERLAKLEPHVRPHSSFHSLTLCSLSLSLFQRARACRIASQRTMSGRTAGVLVRTRLRVRRHVQRVRDLSASLC